MIKNNRQYRLPSYQEIEQSDSVGTATRLPTYDEVSEAPKKKDQKKVGSVIFPELESETPSTLKKQIDPSKYETKLNFEEEGKFQSWLTAQKESGNIQQGDYDFYKKNDYGYNYDFRAAFKAGENSSINKTDNQPHWSDIGKKPNHPTFSTESKYNGADGNIGGTWEGEKFIPPKSIDIVGLAREHRDLGEKISILSEPIYTPGGGTITPKEPVEYKNRRLEIEKQVQDEGYDPKEIFQEFSQFPTNAKNVDIPALLQEKKDNPLSYERHKAAYKWQAPLFEAIRKQGGEFAEGIINRIVGTQEGSTYNTKRSGSQDAAEAIRTYISDKDEQERLLKDLARDKAFSYGIDSEEKWNAISQDERYLGGSGLNKYQVQALHFLEDTDPEKAEVFNKLLSAKPEDKSADFQRGYEYKARELERFGMDLEGKALEERMTDLINKKNKTGIDENDVKEYTKMYEQYESLQADAKNQTQRFPAVSALDADMLAQEALGQRSGAVKKGVLGIGENVNDAVNFVGDILQSPFRSKDERTIDDLEDLGEKQLIRSSLRYTRSGNQLVEPETVPAFEEGLQKDIKGLKGNLDERLNKARELITNNFEKVGNVKNPDAGKFNFTSNAIFNTISDVGSEILSNVGLAATTGGAGNVSKLRSLSTLFGTTFATAYNDYYTQAIEQNIPNPTTYATIHTAIEAGSELINNDLSMVKKTVNPKSTLGQIVNNISQKEWDDIVLAGKGRFANILEAGKRTAETATSNAFKETYEEVAGQVAGNIADVKMFNQDVDLTDGLKSTIVNTLVGTFPLGFVGLPGQINELNRSQKYSLYEVAQSPEKYLQQLDSDLKAGNITPEKAEQVREIIKNVSGQLQQNEDITEDKSDNEKADILAESITGIKEEKTSADEIKNETTEATIPDKRTDTEIEKRMMELEGNRDSREEFNALEKEMEKRERSAVFDVPLNQVSEAVDALTRKEKEKPNGYGSFIERRDARETKDVAEKYVNAKDIPDADVRKDFKEALMGNPATWYADGLKLRESMKEAANRGIEIKELIAEAKEAFIKDGYDNETANNVIAQRLKPIYESSEKATENTERVVPEQAKEELPAEATSPETIGATEEGEGAAIPPTEPPKAEPVVEEDEPLRNKRLATRLVGAKNIPAEARKGIESEGLKYEPKSQQEAEVIAKSIIDEAGIDEAVLQAQAQKFGGDINTLVQTESLNRLAELSEKETDPVKKLEYDKKFAEVGIALDEWARDKAGRGIAALNYFYKKSPLGVAMIENAKRKEDFENFAKPKDKPWKEFFAEMMKEPEFEKVFKEQVSEGIKQERAEARKARIKKVDDFIDKAKDQFKNGGATYTTIIPPKVITAALEGIKKAYHAGEAVVKIVQDAIDYISKELGHDNWDKEKFRGEWLERLKETNKKPLTDEELKTRLLDKFRRKLKGLSDKQKEDVVRKSFQKIVESGGLDYEDFRKIIADITGRGELTEEETKRLKELVKQTNAVDEAGKKARTDRTDKSLKEFRAKEIEAGRASRELNELLWNKPDIIRRLTSIMQLNTLGIPSLINNPIYNFWNQITVRYPVGLINSLLDRGVKAVNKDHVREYNTSLAAQKEFFKKLGFGTKESVEQLLTGLNRQDYIQKEIYGQQIRPVRAIRDLYSYLKGDKKLTKSQIIDKAIQGTVGIPAEIVARALNIGDKPQRFAAEGAQGAAFAKALGLEGMDYKLFMEFPREEAYRVYKEKGLSDAAAGKKADYIKDVIIKEGQRSTFQQDNLLNDVLTRAFGVFGGKDSGAAALLKATTVSPFIKIPSNAFWSYYNLINPEIALLQSLIHAGRALSLRKKGDNSSALAMREARYWFAHAATGIAMRGVVALLVQAGIFVPANTADDPKKEREGESFFEPQGTVNLTKLFALLRGDDPAKVKGGVTVQNRWFGQWGTVGNAMARKYEDMTPEQREHQMDFWNIALGGMEKEALKDLEQGVFSNSSALLGALNESGSYGMNRYLMNTLSMFTNIVHPAAFAQISRAQLPYYSTPKADSFLEELGNTMATRSSWVRKLTGKYPPSKISIWGEPMKRDGATIEKLFGINRINKDNFAQPIYEDVKRTGDTGFFPAAIQPNLNGQKLNTGQYNLLQQYVGSARKDFVAPYVNNMGQIEGFDVKYHELNDEDKKYVLEYLYNLGRQEGIKKFEEQFPEFKKEEKQPEYEQEVKKDIFKILQKYK